MKLTGSPNTSANNHISHQKASPNAHWPSLNIAQHYLFPRHLACLYIQMYGTGISYACSLGYLFATLCSANNSSDIPPIIPIPMIRLQSDPISAHINVQFRLIPHSSLFLIHIPSMINALNRHTQPANLNRVASSLPSPSRGATFLLR